MSSTMDVIPGTLAIGSVHGHGQVEQPTLWGLDSCVYKFMCMYVHVAVFLCLKQRPQHSFPPSLPAE